SSCGRARHARCGIGDPFLADRPTPPAIARERADRVAVRAHEIALRDLRQDLLSRMSPEALADVSELLKSGQVVPLHDLAREHLFAVRARFARLQTSKPAGTTSVCRL